jgi:uncharacterized membrane protein
MLRPHVKILGLTLVVVSLALIADVFINVLPFWVRFAGLAALLAGSLSLSFLDPRKKEK